MDSDHSMGSAHPSPEPSTCSDKPTTPTGLDLAQEVASFMQALFRARCNDHAPEKLKLPAWMNQDLLEDCYLAVDVIYTASLLRNSYETNWDIVKYMAAGPPSPGPYPAGTEPLFPNAFSQAGTKPVDLVDVPGHIKDSEGRIMAWYLPSIISKRRQAQVQNAIIRMVDERKKPLPIDTRFGTNWRTHPFWFQDAKETRVPGGCICYSPCWYEQGHTPPAHKPGPSATLANDTGTDPFLAEIQEINALVGGALAIVQPFLFAASMKAWRNVLASKESVKNHARMEELLGLWPSPFTAISLIVNRETPIHRDPKGGKFLFDAVLTLGNYKRGRFEIPGVGMRVRYDPGTMVLLASHTLAHGASMVDADRYCIASFFRPHVLKAYGDAAYEFETPENLISIKDIRMFYSTSQRL